MHHPCDHGFAENMIIYALRDHASPTIPQVLKDDAKYRAIMNDPSNGFIDHTDYTRPDRVTICIPHRGPVAIRKMERASFFPFFADLSFHTVIDTDAGMAPNERMHIYLLYKKATTCEQCNQHLYGIDGDAFINVIIATVGKDGNSFTQGNAIPHEFISTVFAKLKHLQDVDLSPYDHLYKTLFASNMSSHHPTNRHMLDAMKSHIEDVRHPHIERLINEDNGALRLVIKSKRAFKYALATLLMKMEYLNTDKHNLSEYLALIEVLTLNDFIDVIPAQLPNASLTFDEYGQRMQPLIVRLYYDYFRLLRNKAEASIDRERRVKGSEEREKREAAERAALDAEKAVKVAAQRLAALEAGVAAATASTPRKAKGKGGKGGGKGKNRTAPTRRAEAAAIHDHHVSPDEKARRTAVWELRHEMAHLEAEARRTRLEAERLKTASEAEGARLALKEQVVPSAPTVAAFFEAGEA